MARCFGKLREKPFPRFCDGMRGAIGGHATACDSHLPSTTRANTAKKEEGLSRTQGRTRGNGPRNATDAFSSGLKAKNCHSIYFFKSFFLREIKKCHFHIKEKKLIYIEKSIKMVDYIIKSRSTPRT
jgi:hypothetical protein